MIEIAARALADQPTAVVRRRLQISELPDWIGAAFATIPAVAASKGLALAGAPFARYWMVPGVTASFDVEAGFPVDGTFPAEANSDVVPSWLPAGTAAVAQHLGSFDTLPATYEALEKWIAGQGGTAEGAPWETYLSEPESDPASWRTEIVQPYRVG